MRRGDYWWTPDLSAVVDGLREAGWTVTVEHRELAVGRRWTQRRGGPRLVVLYGTLGDRDAPVGRLVGSWRAEAGGELEREEFTASVGPSVLGARLESMTPVAVLVATRRLRKGEVCDGR